MNSPLHCSSPQVLWGWSARPGMIPAPVVHDPGVLSPGLAGS